MLSNQKNKIDKLESHIAKLNDIIDKYRNTKDSNSIADLKKVEIIEKSKVIKDLHDGDDSDEIKRSITTMQRKVGTCGADRKKIIKQAVRVIINHIVSERTRILFRII